MAIKLHRCGNEWVKFSGHPCWRVEKALIDMGIEYELAPGPWLGKRPEQVEHTGSAPVSGDRVRRRHVVPRGVE